MSDCETAPASAVRATGTGPDTCTAAVSPARDPVTIDRYRGGDRDEWNAFVRRASGGTFFHLIGWKDVIEQTFGFTSHYLLARRAAEIVGVLPLFELRSLLSGRCLLSVPFAVEGGVCSVDAEARAALEQAACALARDTKARYLELQIGRAHV